MRQEQQARDAVREREFQERLRTAEERVVRSVEESRRQASADTARQVAEAQQRLENHVRQMLPTGPLFAPKQVRGASLDALLQASSSARVVPVGIHLHAISRGNRVRFLDPLAHNTSSDFFLMFLFR